MSGIPPPNESQQVQSDSGIRKRKRKTLACNNCRRQKLRCDRAIPVCGRCRVAGSAEVCMYGDSAPGHDTHSTNTQAGEGNGGQLEHNTHSVSTPQSVWAGSHTGSSITPQLPLAPVEIGGPDLAYERGPWKRAVPQVRMAEYPSSIWHSPGQGSKHLSSRQSGQVSSRQNAVSAHLPEFMVFRGELFSTQYSGATNPISSIARFPELTRFMVEAINQDHALAHVQRSLKRQRLQWKQAKPTTMEIASVDFRHLLELLPDRGTVDRLVQTYWDTFETLYHILHGPSFWSEYDLLWSTPLASTADFIVTVLLIMASFLSTRECCSLEEVCEFWIERQSQKTTPLSYWQIRCLLLLSKLSSSYKKKRTWSAAGNLMRLAMSGGFHRDPNLLGVQMSPLNQEMRRRLWATMVELELQISIDRGMSSAAANAKCDTANVLNIHDDDLDERGRGTQGQPPGTHASASFLHISRQNARNEDLDERGKGAQGLPSGTYTSVSFLHISRQSLPLRMSLNELLNNSINHPTHEDVVKYDEEITQSLQEINSLVSDSHRNGARPFPELPKVLLDIQLRQYLLLLHSPFAINPESGSRYSLSRLACFEAASTILDKCNNLSPAEYNTISLTRSHIYRSALNICQVIDASRSLQQELQLQRLGDNLHVYVETALGRLGNNITQLGTGYTFYWYISAAFGLLKSKLPSADVQVEQKVAVDRVVKQYYKVLASQEDMTTPKALETYRRAYGLSTANTNIMGLTGEQALASASSTNLAMPQMSFQLEPPDPQLEEYFFGDPEAWTFENLW